MTTYDFVILGGGVAGLSFAAKMARHGAAVLILEREDRPGGLAKTITHDGFRMDYCGHRFHTRNQEVLQTVLSLPDLDMRTIGKTTRIYMFGKYLKYPFELPNLLRAMPKREAVRSAVSFLLNMLHEAVSPSEVVTYRDWFVRLYGERLYEVMCEPYTSKIWHMPPDTISADWADQRFSGPNLVALMKKSVRKLLTLDFSSYDLEDDRLAPDGGDFYYPSGGSGDLPDAFAREVERLGGTIRCCVEVAGVDTAKKEVVYADGAGDTSVVGYRNLISTIPLSSYYRLQNRRDAEVEADLQKLRYLDVVFVYLFVDAARISPDHWIYFPDADVPFNRVVEFSNWSERMAPPGKTCLCLDATCYVGDATWNCDDGELARSYAAVLRRIGYLGAQRISGSYVKRVRYGYPVYDLGYRDRLARIVHFLEQDDVLLLGRTGIFRYNNSDNSIEMALELADRFLAGRADRSIFSYTIREASL